MAISTWPIFIRRCLLRRTAGAQFQELATRLNDRSPISGAALIQALLSARDSFSVAGDPLILVYLRAIFMSSLALPSDVLITTIQHRNKSKAEDMHTNDTVLINYLAELIVSAKKAVTTEEARKCLVLAARWLITEARWASHDSDRLIPKTTSMVEAIGIVLVTVMSTETGAQTLAKDGKVASASREPRNSVREALDLCLPLLSTISPQLFHKLDSFQKHFGLFEEAFAVVQGAASSKILNFDVISFESSILDVQVTPSKAALALFLDAKLQTCITIDDSSLLNFLNTRHNGNHETMFLELITSSFQVLTNWNARNEAEQAIKKIHHFIVNKVPSLLSLVTSSSFGSFSSENCLLSAMLEVSSTSAVANQFVAVCVSYELASPTTLEMRKVESPQGPDVPERYQKDEIVIQIKSSPQKAAKLVQELPLLHGNSGVISQALVEVMHAYCHAKDTSALKDIANSIVRHPEMIDVIALFVPPNVVLGPVCALLDSWKWDDLHGESQPVYDEFGSLLLFIQAFKLRLGLPISGLGIARTSPFMRRLLEQNSTEVNLDELSEDMQKHLGEWINALFIAEGLTDELTSSCSPQEFYLLVPTLLNQSLLAFGCGKLAWETLRSGLEYLLDPFLLPSLIPALLWLSSHSQKFRSSNLVARVLKVLMKPPENKEANEMHRAILGMASESLQRSLPIDVSESKSLLANLPLNCFTSKIKASDEDFQKWSAMPGGVLSTIEQSFQHLVYEASGNESFTYLLIEHGIKLNGAHAVLIRLVQQLHDLVGSQVYGKGLDVAAAIICSGSQPDLHNALRLEHNRLGDVLRKNRSLSETLVRLHRRVESLIGMPQEPELSLGTNLAELDMQNVVATDGPGIDVSALAEVQDQPQDIDAVLDAAAAAAMGQMDQSNINDDVFETQDDDMAMMNFDDLDMDGMF